MITSGKPIIIPEEGGVAERVAAGNGVAVRIGDVDGLTSAITRICADAQLRVRMGEAGRQYMATRYSWQAVASAYEEVYRGSAAATLHA